VATGQLTMDGDIDTGKDVKQGTNSVIAPDKDQLDTMCAINIFETYTRKHIKANTQDVQSGSSTEQPPLHKETKKGFFLCCGAGSQSFPSDCAWEKSV